jgi:hypothetical protein
MDFYANPCESRTRAELLLTPPHAKSLGATLRIMDPFPTRVDLAEDPDTTGEGHLWILELVEGVPLRFALQSDGRIVFSDEKRRYEPGSEPPAVWPAVESVQSSFRRDAFREAIADAGSVTFYGVATCQRRLAYDWDRLPPFLGYDVRVPDRGGLLTPEDAHASFDRLGLTPAPAVERELRADAFDPAGYTFPGSEWADAPVAGIVVADKHEWRGRLDNPETSDPPQASFESPVDAAERLVPAVAPTTDDTVEAVRNRIVRRHHAELSAAGIDPSEKAFRRAVAEAVQRRQ